ncbi:peptidylprolyl isomerase [Hydrocarboniphaga sp.]|uniref:peptidylprolyl isomerase n=1 Tax=Hydrocarboniphaga sp. TaxID=2033016 RepID=UPI003D09E1B4
MRLIQFSACAVLVLAACTQNATKPAPVSAAKAAVLNNVSEVLAQTRPADWREPAPDNLLVMQLATGSVVMELAPQFAPHHADNIRALAHEHYYDGLSILRVQENYVVQWGDPDEKREIKSAQRTIAGEFWRPTTGLNFTPLADGDVYAPEVGYSDGFAAARDPKRGEAWLAHCYGALGVGRGMGADSGGGPELYVVIGHSPRHLDRNITVAGRVLQGMEHLTVLPRGTGALGFYEKPEQYVTIRSLQVASDMPAAQRPQLQVLRTDTASWDAYVDVRRNRRDSWFLDPVGHVELCNVGVPVRTKPG